jgi:DNA-binding transcriptional LysR family regulator
MIDVGETALLPSLLARLAAEAPSISLRVLDVSRQNYEDYLDSGVADMVIGDVTLSDTFRSRLLFESLPVALLDRSHPFIDVAPNQILSIGHAHYLEAQHVAIVPRGTIDSQLEAGLGSEAQRRNIKLSIPHTAVLSVILPGTELDRDGARCHRNCTLARSPAVLRRLAVSGGGTAGVSLVAQTAGRRSRARLATAGAHGCSGRSELCFIG